MKVDYVRTIGPVDSNTACLCNITDYLITRNRMAAVGKMNMTVLESFNDDSCTGLGLLFLNSLNNRFMIRRLLSKILRKSDKGILTDILSKF